MATLQNDIQNILDRINNELTEIESQSREVGEIVEADLDALYDEYRTSGNPKIDIDQFKQRYRERLRTKKLESLNIAKSKLIKLRSEITFALAS